MQSSHSNHYIIMCSCGAVLEQCRCDDRNKPVTTRTEACARCVAKKHDAEQREPSDFAVPSNTD